MSFSSDNPLQSNQLPISIDFGLADQDHLLELLETTYKRIANAMNTKEGALYLLQEIATFKQWYTKNNPQVNRNVYRRTFDLVALNGGNIGAGATVAFNHGITTIFNTAITYVCCTSTVPEYFSVMMYPYVFANATQISFTNPSASALTQADFVFEYLKN